MSTKEFTAMASTKRNEDAMEAALTALAVLDIEVVDRCPVAGCPICDRPLAIAA